ncbi:MAG: hypothetical protein K2G93_06625 [Rikenella sp.]|nr:hypothetical protein [Rikenella sp.]
MRKAIYYKEWLKTRWYLGLSSLLLVVLTGYCLLNISRVIEFKGAVHLWEVMLERDAIFVDLLTYVPLLIGLLLGVFQYAPEMQQSRLKLTLHLPYPHYRTVAVMLSYGTVSLCVLYAVSLVLIGVGFRAVVAHELFARVLLTALPWYVAGLGAYFLTAWVCLEPTWKRRILDILVAAGVLRLYFLAPAPEAYNRFLPGLTLFTLALSLLSMLSVYRFKTGEQDR